MSKQSARDREKRLWKKLTVCGREFRIYYVTYEDDQTSCPDLPDFSAEPQYTSDGKPFALSIDEACEHGEAPDGGEECEDCASCKYLFLEHSGDPIGVCENSKRRIKINNSQDETEEII